MHVIGSSLYKEYQGVGRYHRRWNNIYRECASGRGGWGECTGIVVIQKDATQGWGSGIGKLREDLSEEIEATMIRLVP